MNCLCALKGGNTMKNYWENTVIGILLLAALLIYFNFFYYPIKLDINRANVDYAKIIYFGDGVEQKIDDKNELDLLTQTLNGLKFRNHRDMSHLFPKSGVLVIDLYNNEDKCIDSIQFYEWEYRGGEADGKERGDGRYLKVKYRDDIYDLCDKLCGDPFNRLKFKEQYGW